MRRWPRSLTVRLALFTGAWVAAGLLVVWFWVSDIVSEAAEHAFDARLVSLLDALVAATGQENGRPFLIHPVSEPRFDRPLSGVYYQIEGPEGVIAASRSLWDQQLPRGKPGRSGILMTDTAGPRGQHLRVAERDIVPPGNSAIVHVLAAAARDETLAEIARVRRRLAVGFSLLGVGLVSAVVLQVSVGLGSLRRLRGAVAELRTGGELGVPRATPSEVWPLVQEIDALARQNRATVERARNHVGNLAHALRTRLSILRIALDTGDTALMDLELTKADQLVQHHLARARAASLSGAAATSLSAASVAEDVASALRILFVDRGLSIEVEGDWNAHVRCEREDFSEMLGNLMENACKAGSSLVRVTVGRESSDVVITVSDNGPGLAAERLRQVRDRGIRLDETVPGSGLGLAIVADLAALYEGGLELISPGPDGGLAAHLRLPGARWGYVPDRSGSR